MPNGHCASIYLPHRMEHGVCWEGFGRPEIAGYCLRVSWQGALGWMDGNSPLNSLFVGFIKWLFLRVSGAAVGGCNAEDGHESAAEGRKAGPEQKRSKAGAESAEERISIIMDIVVLIIVLFLKDLCPFYGHLWPFSPAVALPYAFYYFVAIVF